MASWPRVVFLLLLSAARPIGAVIVNGVDDPNSPQAPAAPPPVGLVSAPPAGAVVIDFDDQVQPCLFAGTTRLTTEYAAMGVTFAGPGGNDGGAIGNRETAHL